MILQSLVKYYEALEQKGEITRPGWCKAKISFALDLSEDGKLKQVIPLKTEKIRGKKTVWEPSTMTVPQMVTRSSGVSSNFLCDNSSYLLGIDNKGKPERSLECFECAKAKHLEILKDVESPAARAVTRYFETWEPDKAKENPALSEVFEELISGANLVFWIDTDYAQEDPWIKEAWEKYSSNCQNTRNYKRSCGRPVQRRGFGLL